MEKCSKTDCKSDVYNNSSFCMPHREESKFRTIQSDTDLIDVITEKAHLGTNQSEMDKRDTLTIYLTKKPELSTTELSSIKITMKFSNVIFNISSQDQFHLASATLNKLHAIEFNSCTFNSTGILLNIPKNIKFHECNFLEEHSTSNNTFNSIESYREYENCYFLKKVKCTDSEQNHSLLNNYTFINCNFKQDLDLSQDNKSIQITTNVQNYINIDIKHSTFEKRFTLNDREISNLDIEKSTFGEKIEIRRTNITEDFKLNSVKITDILDLYKCKISRFSIERARFYGYVGFENCEFGNIGRPKESKPVTFTYATFEDILNFRDARFNDGLNIAMINAKVTPNFHGVYVKDKNSNRETFRIIKNALDSVGNHIEANKFYALEMKKHHEEIKKSGRKQEIVIFFLNRIFSNFGQSYIQPMAWLIATSLLLLGITELKESNLLYSIYLPANIYISKFVGFFNNLALNVVPFKRFLIDGLEFLSLLFYVINITLIWLTITSIKRKTKR